jgi:hypothetical protein
MITDKGWAPVHTQGNSIIGNKEGEPCAKSLMNSNPVGGYRSTMIDIPIRIITMETKEKKESNRQTKKICFSIVNIIDEILFQTAKLLYRKHLQGKKDSVHTWQRVDSVCSGW